MRRRTSPDRRRVEFGLYIANDRRSGMVDRRLPIKKRVDRIFLNFEQALQKLSRAARITNAQLIYLSWVLKNLSRLKK